MSVLYLYILIFTIYFGMLIVSASGRLKKYRDKYTSKDANICVVVYASGVVPTLENLLKQLKSQNYPKNNYTIYAILDKCENIPEVTLQGDLKVNVININNIEPVGKSQAYSIIAEKLRDVKDLDAYVFLNAKNYVESDFLSNINFYLTKYDVFNPKVIYLPEDKEMSFKQNVLSAYSRYVYKFFYLARTKLGLTNILNSDSFVIKKDLLNKIAVFDYRNIMAETEYTLKLAQEGSIVAVIDDLPVYDSIETFEYRIPSLSGRLKLLYSFIFKNNNLITKEFLLSLAMPNWLVCVFCFILPLINSYSFPAAVSYSTILITFTVFLMLFTYSLFKMNFYAKEYIYLFCYPVFSIWRILYNFPFCRWIRNIFSKTTRKPVLEKMSTNVVLTDGTREIHAKLELISDDGLAKVVFINPNGKKYTTKNNHLRMVDALRELSGKLSDYGMTLKVCQNCKYFQHVVDGSTNMVKGTCNCNFQGRTPGDIIPTLIWNTCPNFEEHNVVNLFD